jgi:hypothetical protein
VNGTTTNGTVTGPAAFLPAPWVTAANMEATVIQDGWISAKDLCNAVGKAVCRAAGIK